VNRLITVPSSLLGSETYTFTLTLQNFLGFSAPGSGVVSIVGNVNLPTLTITGGSTATFFAYQTLSMSCLATVSSCATTNQISFTTAIFLGAARLSFRSTSVDPRTFRLAPYTLDAGYTYRVLFNATSAATFQYPAVTASTSGFITIARGVVIASIRGGSSRQSPIDKTLTLDATSSSDQDTISNSALTYRWACVISSVRQFGGDCSYLFASGSSSGIVTVAPFSMNTTLSYTFQVLVTSPDGRFSSASADVFPSGVGGVTVSITSSVSIINAGSRLSLTGTIYANYSVSTIQVFAFWTAYYSGAVVSVPSLTSQSQTFSAAAVRDTISFPIAFDANTFIQGRTYVFRLSAYPTFDRTLSSFTETSVVINSPPSGGVVSVDPARGNALETEFYISTRLWTSSNLPLSYSFSYQLSSTSSELTVGSINQVSFAKTTLPSGLSSNNNLITINCYAYDSLLASAKISTSAAVTLSEKVSQQIGNVLSTSLASSFSSGNVDGAVQAVNNIATTVNAVNCSAASKAFCASLFRSDCQAVPNTCGACLAGYSGVIGNSNRRCFINIVPTRTPTRAPTTANPTPAPVIIRPGDPTQSPIASPTMPPTQIPTKAPVGPAPGTLTAPCVTNDDCFLGFCDNFFCAEPLKTCPGSSGGTECSGNGVCQYLDSANTILKPCGITNVNCYPKCLCNTGYGGSDCSLNPKAAASRDTLRTTLCQAINSVYSSSGPSSTTLNTLAGSLQSSFQPDEVNSAAGIDSCANALEIVTTLAEQGYLKDLPVTTVNTLFSTISTFIAKASELSASGSDSITSVSSSVDQLSSGVVQTLVDGQAPLDLVSDNFQTSVNRPRLADLQGSSLSPPLTDSEKAYGSLGPKIILTENGLSACQATGGYLRLTVSKFARNPNPNSQSQRAPILKFQSYVDSTSTTTTGSLDPYVSSRTTSHVSFTPLYYVVLQFSSVQDFNFTQDVFSPDYKRTSNVTIPSCTLFNGVENVPCYGCNVTSYSNYNVTYGCKDISLLCTPSTTTNVASSTRKLLDTDQSVAASSYFDEISSGRLLGSTDDTTAKQAASGSQFGAILALLLAELSSVLSSNPFALDLSKAQGILSFVGALIFTIIFGVLYFMQWDRQDLNTLNELKRLNFKKGVKLANAERYDFDLKGVLSERVERSIWGDLRSLVTKETPTSQENEKTKKFQFENEIIRSQAKTQAVVFDFLEIVAPKDLLTNRHPFQRVTDLLYKLHKFTAMFSGPSLFRTRTYRWLALVRGVLVGLFTDTLFFGIFFPDDGSCDLLTTEALCLFQFNQATQQTQCAWKPDNSAQGGVCSLNPPPSDFTFTILIALMTVIIGVPLDIMIAVAMEEGKKIPRLEEIGLSSEYWLGYKKKDENAEKEEKSPLKKLLDAADAMRVDRHQTLDAMKQKAALQGKLAYNEFLSVDDEVNVILRRVREFLTNYLHEGYMHWQGNSHAGSVQQSKLKAILTRLGINPDGTPVPLSFMQYWTYGTPRNRLSAKLDAARTKAQDIADRIEDLDYFEVGRKDAVLIQYFVLEQFSIFKRFCLRREFFVYDDVPPENTDPITWIMVWIFIFGALSFFVYWVFAWGVKNGGNTLTNWGLNYGIGAVQDIFFVQIAKIYIIRYIGIEASKPQLRNIYRVLNNLFMRYAIEGVPPLDDIKVVQFMSAACRASRMYETQDLASSRILSTLNDDDALKCKEGASIPIGYIAFFILAIPTIFALISELFSDIAIDIILPAGFGGFLIFNQTLTTISIAGLPWYFTLAIPYILIVTYFVWLYFFLNPSKRRVNKLKSIQPNERSRERWSKYIRQSRKGSISAVFSVILSYLQDMQARMILLFSSSYYEDPRQKKVINYWRLMNIPSKMQGRVNVQQQTPVSPRTDIYRGMRAQSSIRDLMDQGASSSQAALDAIPASIQKLYKRSKIKTSKFKLVKPKSTQDDKYDIIADHPDDSEITATIYQRVADTKLTSKSVLISQFESNLAKRLEIIKQTLVDVAERVMVSAGVTPNENIMKTLMNFDDLIIVLREFWQVYYPGGEALDQSEIDEVEDAFITWMAHHPSKFTKGIKLSKFHAWLEPVCEQITNVKEQVVVFEAPVSPTW
jgi:hypothetical protein